MPPGASIPEEGSIRWSPASERIDPLKFFTGAHMPRWKRSVDVVGAVLGIVCFAPVMLAIAAAITLTSPGKVIFRQKRAGLGGAPFDFLKFRSMVADAEERKGDLIRFNERTGPAFKMARDPRVTPIGRLIRKWSLDELPQFFNVLRGDMSLVGPRPLPYDEYLRQDLWHHRRCEVKPGITCLWQVYARHDPSFDRWVRLDLEYMAHQSLALDLAILMKTVFAVLRPGGPN